MKLLKTLAAAAVMTLAASSSFASDVVKGDITVSKTWTRATPPKAMAGGGFAEITNAGAEDDRLVAATSPAAGRVELHEMAVNDGVMKMRQLEKGVPVPAGQTVDLKPGGLHIMFMDLNGPFKEGDTVPVTLTFEKAGEVDVELTVEKIGAKGMAHMDHGKMDHDKMGHGDQHQHGKN